MRLIYSFTTILINHSTFLRMMKPKYGEPSQTTPWYFYTFESLKKEIKERPLTMLSIDEIVQQCEIRFVDASKKGGRCFKEDDGVTYPSKEKNTIFIIEINEKRTKKTQEITLLHESLHAYYRAFTQPGFFKGATPQDKIIDKETKRLYLEKHSLLEYLLDKLNHKIQKI